MMNDDMPSLRRVRETRLVWTENQKHSAV